MNSDVVPRPKSESQCLVCGDKASGRHYGVPSCDGCRGFFKRSIRRQLEYTCKESNQCVVDVSRRNQCQACRFRKCLEVNMKREAVQHERAPRGIKRGYPSDVIPPPTTAVPLAPQSVAPVNQFYGGSVPFPWTPTLNPLIQNSRQFNVFPSHNPYFTCFAPAIATDELVDLRPVRKQAKIKDEEVSSSANEGSSDQSNKTTDLDESASSPEPCDNGNGPNSPTTAADPPASGTQLAVDVGDAHGARNDSSALQRTCSEARLAPTLPVNTERASQYHDGLSNFAVQYLFITIQWAKSIPFFSQLSCLDQNVLLESSWCELFILTMVQCNIDLNEANILQFCPDERRSLWLDALQQLRQLLSRILSMRMDQTEFVILKALALFKPDARGLRDTLSVEFFQDRMQHTLQEHCAVHNPPMVPISLTHGTHYSLRFGKLLLLLAPIRAIPTDFIIDVFFHKTPGDTPFARLLAEFITSPSQ